MVVMIVVTYSCIAPLIMPLGLLYFTFAYLMYKYQLLYVFINDYQSGGFNWYAVFSRSVVALIGGSLTMMGYIGIHMTQYTQAFYFLLPLPLCLLYFWHRCTKHFQHKTSTLSLEDAIEIDSKTQQSSTNSLCFRRSLYCQPSLVEGELLPDPYRRPSSMQLKYGSPARGIPESQSPAGFMSPEDVCDEIEKEQHMNELLDLISPVSLFQPPSLSAATAGGSNETTSLLPRAFKTTGEEGLQKPKVKRRSYFGTVLGKS